MTTRIVEVTLYAPWVNSLKDKRTLVKGLIQKIQNRFNVSIIESSEQDTHRIAVVAFCLIADNAALADSTVQSVLAFIEQNTDAEITGIRNV